MLLILWFVINFDSHTFQFRINIVSLCVCLSLKALTKISDVTESKLILKRTRLQSNMSICHSVENHLAVQSICDRVLNFDLQPHYRKETHGSDVMD